MGVQKMTTRHLLVVFTCALGIFTTSAFTFSCPGLAYKPVANYLGLQVSDVSFYQSIVYFCEVIFSPVVGALLERVDIRIMGCAAVVANSVGWFIMSQGTDIIFWYGAGVLLGFSQITILWLITAGALGRWFKDKLGLMLGICYAMTGAGGAIWNIMGQFILGPNLLVEETWRNLYMTFGAIALVPLPFYALCLRNAPEDVGLKKLGAPLAADGEEEVQVELKGMEPKEAYKTWYFYVLCLAGCAMNILGIFPQHYTTYYQVVVAVDANGIAIPDLMIMSGTLESFSMVGMLCGKIITGAVESKSLQAALWLGIISGCIAIACLWWGGFNKVIPVLFGGGLIYGCVYAWVTVLLPFITRRIYGDLHYDQIYSVVLIPVNLVGATAASGLALINQMFGWSVFWCVAIGSIAVTWALATIAFKVGSKNYDEKILGISA